MRRALIGILIVSLVAACGCQNKGKEKPAAGELEGTITMSGAWALYPMAVKWAEEFQKIHPKVKIDVAAGGAGKGMADALAGVVDIGLVSRDLYPAEIEKRVWWISVVKDAVVPTINDKNPVLQDLLQKGARRETFVGIWITGTIKNWGDVISSTNRQAIRVYTRSDACGAAATWAQYLGRQEDDLQGVGVYGDPGVAEAIKNDVLGIGFNNINYAYDPNSREPIQGIRVLPIDVNGNGRIDEDEDFYQNRDAVVEAIASGRYPSPPARDLHFVSRSRPTAKAVTEFMRWILTDGQAYVAETGYINLSEEKLKQGLDKLSE